MQFGLSTTPCKQARINIALCDVILMVGNASVVLINNFPVSVAPADGTKMIRILDKFMNEISNEKRTQ